MKNTIKLIALALVLVMSVLTLAACAKTLSGKYQATVFGNGTVLTFNGNKVTIAITAFGKELGAVEANYEIKDDKISFSFPELDDSADAAVQAFADALKEPVAFEEGDDYIKIGSTKYNKAKD